MYGNIIRRIENESNDECLAMALYFYNICSNIHNIDQYSTLLELFNILITAFDKKEQIVNALIEKSIREKQLHIFTPDENYKNPFGYCEILKNNFKEDEKIYQKTYFCSNTELDINITRCTFVDNSYFAKMIACTFFSDDVNIDVFSFDIEPKIRQCSDTILNDITAVQFLITMLKLSNDEAQLLLLAYRAYSIHELYEVFNQLYNNPETRISIYAKALNVPIQKIQTLLRNDKKLVSFGFIKSDGELNEYTVDCIFSGSLDPVFVNILKEEKPAIFFNLESFSVKKSASELAVNLLKNNSGINLLLYGSPGAGKTEFAKALAVQTGLQIFSFKNEMENNEENVLRQLNCLLSIEKKDSIIIVDEAENILKTCDNFFGMITANAQKGIVNKILEHNVNKVIWILNYIDLLDSSTFRRFSYSIQFGEMSKSMRQKIAASKLQEINIGEKLLHRLVDLCGAYHVTGASIENMIKAINSTRKYEKCEEKIIENVKSVFEANAKLLYGTSIACKKIQSSYSTDVLNTSIASEEIISMLQNAFEYSKQTDIQTGIRMLFYGLSGTGKTEFARYIAEVLDKKIILKKGSDILGKYVGETEEKIKEAFEEAALEGSILLFDEADSFFSNRIDANHRWERTIVNEFLTQMEDFTGLLICTTNMRQLMDPAMQRRFHIMTEFKALNKSGIEKLFYNYFGSFKFTNRQTEVLEQYHSVTPGDFASLYGRIRFMPQAKINSEYIIAELIKMQEEKNENRSIGF